MTSADISVLGPLMGGFGSQAFLGCLHGANDAVTPVVLVFLPDDIVDDDALFRRVWAETRTGTTVDHVNVIGVFGLAQLEEGYARVVEYADAESLRSVLRRCMALKKAMPPAVACALVADAAMGVHYAHELGATASDAPFIHGGLRPETLQVTFRGVGKVTGYGATTIAEMVRQGRRDDERDAYAAPEQAYGGRAASTVHTDVYALGCILYEALTSKTPCVGDNELAETLMRDELIHARRDGITEAMHAVVLHATRQKSSERFATALALRDEILETCAPASAAEVARFMADLFPPQAVPRTTRDAMVAAARAHPPPSSGRLLAHIPPELMQPRSIRMPQGAGVRSMAIPDDVSFLSVPASKDAPITAPPIDAQDEEPNVFDEPTFIPELSDEAEPVVDEAPPMALEQVPSLAEITDRFRRALAPRPSAAHSTEGAAFAAPPPSWDAPVTSPPSGVAPAGTREPPVVYRTAPAVLVALGVLGTLVVVGGIALVVQGTAAVGIAKSGAPASASSPPSPVTAPSAPPPSPPASPPVGQDSVANTAPAAPSRPLDTQRASPDIAKANVGATGKLVVTANPPSMVITVNGETIGTGEGKWEGRASTVKVTARDRALGAQASKSVKVRPNDTVLLELEALKGTLTFDQLADGLDVFVDGKRIGRTPMPAIELYSGTHRIDVKKGGATVTLYGDVVAGRELYVTAQF